MKPIFFAKAADFRKWLEKNHDKETELLVGFYKKDSGKPSITWPESVDQAICFGWIDGVRKSIDDISYTIRFTPRKPKSTWSAVNIRKVEELTKQGLMHPAGIAAFNKKEEKNSKIYSFEQKAVGLDENYERIFKQNKKAWKHFGSKPPSYRKACIHWVMSAKQEVTQLKRLDTLITCSAAGEPIPQMKWAKK